MIFIRLFSADAPEVSPVRRCEQITVLQLRNVQSRAAVLKWLLTAGCKRWRRNEWRIFIINILLLWLQARILVFSGERILSPSPSLSPAPLSSLLFLHQTSFYLNSHSLWLHSRWVQRCFWPTKSSILSTNRSGCRPTPTSSRSVISPHYFLSHNNKTLVVSQMYLQMCLSSWRQKNNRNTDLHLLISRKSKVQLRLMGSFAGVVLQNVSHRLHVFIFWL